MYMYEQDEQVAKEGAGDGLGCGQKGVAKKVWPAYSHRFSPKKFSQHQLFACLVLKAFLKTDYRGLAAHLCDCPNLCEAIELSRVPHFTTFQKATRRLLRSKPVDRLLDETVHQITGRYRRLMRIRFNKS